MPSGAPRQPSVAIIVPVYNVEKWLPECLDSIAGQDYANWTATVVIDGSPDGSEQIARRYAEEDPRFTVVSVPNGGLGSARNVGLRHSAGDYVFFVDSDDTVPRDAISSLVDAAARTGADIVAGFAEDFGESWIPSRYWTQTGPLYNGAETTFSAESVPAFLQDHVVWNKLYARAHLDTHGLDFPPRVHCEDMVFSARAALLAQRITVVPRLVYRHRRHDQAISASYTRAKTLSDWLEQSAQTIQWIERLGSPHSLSRYLTSFVRGQWWTRARGIDEITDDDLISRLQNLTITVRSRLDDQARAELGPWLRACIDFFAESEPRLFTDERWAGNPLRLDFGRVEGEVDAALEIAAQLSRGGQADRAMSQALVAERVLRPVADGFVAGEPALLARIAQVYERLGEPRYLIEILGAGDDGGIGPLIERFLREQGRLSAQIHAVKREPRGVVLRGTWVPTAGAHRATTATLVLQSTADGAKAYVPVTWTGPREAGDWRWQAVLPEELLAPETPIRIEIKLEERGAPRGRGPAEPTPSVLHEVVGPARTLSFPRYFFRVDRQERRVFVFPAWRDNPFTTMLQLELFARGYVLRGSSDLAAFVEELTSPFHRGVVHIQWPSTVTDGAVSELDAERRVDEFVGALRTAKQLGRPILWTVHNILPHDTAYHAPAVRLHAELAGLADAVHIMNSRTADVAADMYRLPEEKIVEIPHPSYAGIYGSELEREHARALLGADAESTAVLFFGQLRPYKGLDQLVEAMTTLARRRTDVQLLLAGKPFPGTEQVLERIDRSSLRATCAARFVPDDEVAQWFCAADLLVLPHRAVLNSGTLHLGATFGVPSVLPDEPHLRADFGDEEWVRFFDPSRPSESIAELVDQDWYRSTDVRESARAFARSRLPITTSRRFADLVEAMAGGGGVTK
ncbi:glycosyltransferase [Microbacterium album]|uniref:Glycosyltransferase 2-like domain-containing protein n=1 Tax=Microbacterium album TaxID=2053191 RepID=A0A917IE93_9MICO|nr:glycosyltransferase [Microbacterium album]GGH37593.1 hypothetical protein GCM10010921_07580 [Microbacterium album]